MAQPISPAEERVIGEEADTAIVPLAAGKVQVTSPVKLAEVMVPVKEETAVVVCGLIAILSVLAVVLPNIAEPVPLRLVVSPILSSLPDRVQEGLVVVAALARVSSFTAAAVVVRIINSLPFASAI